MTTAPARLPSIDRRDPPAPAHLSRSSRSMWRRILVEYALEEHHRAILAAALESRDRTAEARAAIEQDGAYIPGRFGTKAHPALAVERDSRLAMLRALRELGLDFEAPSAPRPPSRWRNG